MFHAPRRTGGAPKRLNAFSSVGCSGQPAAGSRRRRYGAGMGAIKPWHIATLCCLVTSAALIGGLVWYLVSRAGRR